MAIEQILESSLKESFWTFNLKHVAMLNCSCGRCYNSKQRFKAPAFYNIIQTYIRPTVCPFCKETAHIGYIIGAKKDNENTFYSKMIYNTALKDLEKLLTPLHNLNISKEALNLHLEKNISD